MPIPQYVIGPSRKAGVMKVSFGPYFEFNCTVAEGVEFAKEFVRVVRVTDEAAKLAYGVPTTYGEGTIVHTPLEKDENDPFGVVAPPE